jgi:hypothetical protein
MEPELGDSPVSKKKGGLAQLEQSLKLAFSEEVMVIDPETTGVGVQTEGCREADFYRRRYVNVLHCIAQLFGEKVLQQVMTDQADQDVVDRWLAGTGLEQVLQSEESLVKAQDMPGDTFIMGDADMFDSSVKTPCNKRKLELQAASPPPSPLSKHQEMLLTIPECSLYLLPEERLEERAKALRKKEKLEAMITDPMTPPLPQTTSVSITDPGVGAQPQSSIKAPGCGAVTSTVSATGLQVSEKISPARVELFPVAMGGGEGGGEGGGNTAVGGAFLQMMTAMGLVPVTDTGRDPASIRAAAASYYAQMMKSPTPMVCRSCHNTCILIQTTELT